MATGWAKGFVIEKARTSDNARKNFSCSLCDHYDSSDKSCNRRSLFIPEVGYDTWKFCSCVSYKPYGPYKDKHIIQLCKAGKGSYIEHPSVQYFDFQEIYDKSKNSINFLEMKKECFDIFYDIYEKKEKSKYYELASFWVPKEFLQYYRAYLCNPDDGLFFLALGCFIFNIGCIPGAKGVRRLAKKFKYYYSLYLLDNSHDKVNVHSVAMDFIIFFSEHLQSCHMYSLYGEDKSEIID